MSKDIVNKIVARAMADTSRKETEASLDPKLKAIQDAFKNNPVLNNREDLATLCGLITGFRPRTTNERVVPFEVFEVLSKAEHRVTKTAICVASGNNQAFGCTSLAEPYLAFSPDTCQLASKEAAERFITQEVASWEDASILTWFANNIGHQNLPKFFAELERSVIPSAAAKK